MSVLPLRMPSRRLIVLGGILCLLLLAALWLAPTLESLWAGLVIDIFGVQRDLHAALAVAIRALEGGGVGAQAWLVALGFGYGVFHAAGPGHGKVVVATYLATQEDRVRQGVLMAIASAMLQGVSAIIVTGGAVLVLRQTMRGAKGLADDVELASFVLLMLLGLALAGRSLWRLVQGVADRDHACDHDHAPLPPRRGGRAAMLASIVSIGLRPCTGAILVLALAWSIGLIGAGVAAVLAMSAGTALTVSAIAWLTVHARRTALRLVGDGHGHGSTVVLELVALAGGIVIALLGLSLLQAALQTARHPLL